jgi:hypothetical protein
MTRSRLTGRLGVVGVAGLVGVLGSGCAARTVEFGVMRPAMLNIAPAGNTISVGNIDANGRPAAAADVTADLRSAIAQSLNPSIRLVASGGVEIDGSIVDDNYVEHTETVSQTCQSATNTTDADGNVQTTWTSYDCSYDVRVGNGTSKVRLSVVATADHRVLIDQIYTSTDSVTSPSQTDVDTLMHNLRASSVGHFARVILPWQDKVAERFKDCDGDDRCKQGLARIKAGDLASADTLFGQVIGAYASGGQVPEKQTKQIGEAFYDRGVTRAHDWRYPEAIADMQQAVLLQPKRAKWPAELASLQQLQRDHQALQAQGAAR